MYAFGSNEHGQLVRSMLCLEACVTLLTLRLPLFVCVLEQGLGHLVHQRQPKLVTALNTTAATVSQLACGASHSAAVTSAGALVTFGRNDLGQLVWWLCRLSCVTSF